MERTKIILDCDPGIDDAVAIMLAAKSPAIDLLGITTVGGNSPLEKTTKNAINVMEWLKIDVPLYKGCASPIIYRSFDASDFHGKDSLAGLKYPPSNKKPQKKHAVNYIIDTLMESNEKITLCVVGPMTNIAMALRLCPKIVDKIDKIVMMGGTPYLGNVTPAAEFNVCTDAEAAQICFNSDIPIYMVGFDITTQTKCFKDTVKRMNRHNNIASSLFDGLMDYYIMANKRAYGIDGAALNDPHVITWLIDPSYLEFKSMHVSIDFSGLSSHGRTNCDIYNRSDKPKNANVAITVDNDKYWDIIEDVIKLY